MHLRDLPHRRRYQLRGRQAGRALSASVAAPNRIRRHSYRMHLARLYRPKGKRDVRARAESHQPAIEALMQLAKDTIQVVRGDHVTTDKKVTHAVYMTHRGAPVAAVFFYFNVTYGVVHFAYGVTESSQQGKGLSKVLRAAVMLYAARRGMTHATTEPINVASQRLAQRLGFRPYVQPFVYEPARDSMPYAGVEVFRDLPGTSRSPTRGGHYFTYLSPPLEGQYLQHLSTILRQASERLDLDTSPLVPDATSTVPMPGSRRRMRSPRPYPKKRVSAKSLVANFNFTYDELGVSPLKASPRRTRARPKG